MVSRAPVAGVDDARKAAGPSFLDDDATSGASVADPAGGTRERLLAAAFAITAEGGYGAASVGAIAGRAGVAAGTLYRHFASKGELFVVLFRRVCGREVVAMRRAAEDVASGPERIVAVLDTFARRALQHPRLAWALLAEPLDPLVEAERLAYRRAYRALLSELLRSAVEDGALPEQDPDLTAAALVGAVGEALVGPLAPGADVDATALLPELRALVSRAIGTAVPR